MEKEKGGLNWQLGNGGSVDDVGIFKHICCDIIK